MRGQRCRRFIRLAALIPTSFLCPLTGRWARVAAAGGSLLRIGGQQRDCSSWGVGIQMLSAC